MKRIVLLSVIALMSAACLGSDFADSVEGPWQMTSGVVDGEQIPLLDSHPITITFEEDRVNGTAACNGYGGSYDLSGSEISFSNLAMTEMACFPDEVMQAEAMFSDAITRVDTVAVEEQLTLSGEGVELVFDALEPVPDAELSGTRWALDGLVEADAVSSPVLDTEAYVELSEDGTLEGDTGCRSFTGRYTISGAEVVVTELAADGLQCEPDLAEQDDRFLSVIGDSFRVEIEENRLFIRARGDEGLTFLAG